MAAAHGGALSLTASAASPEKARAAVAAVRAC
jgi:hypothetical protein